MVMYVLFTLVVSKSEVGAGEVLREDHIEGDFDVTGSVPLDDLYELDLGGF